MTSNYALDAYRAEGNGTDDAVVFAFALADLVTLSGIANYHRGLNDALRDVNYRPAPYLEFQPDGSGCAACGEQVDYCQGHGRYGDPDGANILADHFSGSHDDCNANAECRSSDALWPDADLQIAWSGGTFDDSDLAYATRVMLRYSAWLNSPHAGIQDTYGRDF